MAEIKKAELDAMIRQYGLDRINLDGMTQLASGTFVGECSVNGATRFYEINVVAKGVKYSQADIDTVLMERAAVEERKAIRAKEADAKRKAAAEKKAKQ